MGEYEDYLTKNSKFSDCVKETPIVTEAWCPGCEPERDPITETLFLMWCTRHPNPGSIGQDGGADDTMVKTGGWMSGTNPAEGFTNRQACELVHRQQNLEVPEGQEADTADVYMGDGDCG